MAAKKEKKEKEEDGLPPPGAHDLFLGYERMEQELRAVLLSDRLHHAWLIEGARGLGKATLAWRMARFLLAQNPGALEQGLAIDKTSPAWHLTLAMSHPDFLVITPSAEQKTPTITVDNVRAVQDFFTKSPALGRHRICIVDAVDNMNLNAANALLKLLEEPPDHGIFFLVSHNAGQVLATIRSRCRSLKLSPLADEAVQRVIKAFMPQITKQNMEVATRLARGCPGRALAFASNDGRKLYRDLRALTEGLPQMNARALQSFCAGLSGENSEKYDLFCDLMLDWVSSGICGQIADPARLDQGMRLWDQINEIIRTRQRLNMDRAQAAQNIFLALEQEA